MSASAYPRREQSRDTLGCLLLAPLLLAALALAWGMADDIDGTVTDARDAAVPYPNGSTHAVAIHVCDCSSETP